MVRYWLNDEYEYEHTTGKLHIKKIYVIDNEDFKTFSSSTDSDLLNFCNFNPKSYILDVEWNNVTLMIVNCKNLERIGNALYVCEGFNKFTQKSEIIKFDNLIVHDCPVLKYSVTNIYIDGKYYMTNQNVLSNLEYEKEIEKLKLELNKFREI